MSELSISADFEDGGEIPRRCGYKHGNKSPRLSIKNVPAGCKSLALIMDDPDAVKPAGKVWVHWVIWNIPNTAQEIPEDSVPGNSIQGTTDFGSTGYGGPAPPDGRHTYLFKLYALDVILDLQKGASKKQLEGAIRGHIMQEALLKGTYAP